MFCLLQLLLLLKVRFMIFKEIINLCKSSLKEKSCQIFIFYFHKKDILKLIIINITVRIYVRLKLFEFLKTHFSFLRYWSLKNGKISVYKNKAVSF